MTPNNIKLIDSHCHLAYEGLKDRVDDVIKAAHAVGVEKFINICTKLDEADDVYDIAEQYEEVYATVGVHPSDSSEQFSKYGAATIKEQLQIQAKKPKIVGIGETGLDYYYENSDPKLQRESFATHIEAAIEHDLPVIVHTRNADFDTIDILKSFKGVRGVIHCFSSTKELAYQAMDLGFYISISGITTFKNAQELRDIVAQIPLDHLLIETDAPFLAPVPKRGKVNEPAFMIETFKMLASITKTDPAVLAQKLYNNTLQLFNKIGS